MSRIRSIHPKMFQSESFMMLGPKAQVLLLALGTYSDYANRFSISDKQAMALHCGWAWDEEAWECLRSSGLLSVDGQMATILFTYGHPRAYVSRWEAIRSAVFERDGYACQYCGDHAETLHCDHIHPKSRGGSDEMNNLATACGPCNMSKGSKSLLEWVRNEH